MYQLHLRLNEELEKALRTWADTRGVTMQAAVRIMLHTFLFGPQHTGPDDQPQETQR